MDAATYSTEAVLLASANLGAADKLVNLFTRDRGRLKAMAYGARRPRSGLAGALQLFNLLDLTLTAGERLDTVRQATVLRRFPAIADDVRVMAYAAFIAELTLEFMPEGERNEDVFDWLLAVLPRLGDRNPRLVALAAGWQMLTLAGLAPLYANCAHCGDLIAGGAKFSVAEGGALCRDCADRLANRKSGLHDYPAPTRELLTTLAAIDFTAPPAFTVRLPALVNAESLLRQSLREILNRRLKSLSFLDQICPH